MGTRWISTAQEYATTVNNIELDVRIDQRIWNLLIGTHIINT